MNNRAQAALVLLQLGVLAACANSSAYVAYDQSSLTFVKSDLILARPCVEQSQCTYTYTLASRLASMLGMAETLFGERDRSYTIVGVEFSTDDQPSIWYPRPRNIIIQLTEGCAVDEKRALF